MKLDEIVLLNQNLPSSGVPPDLFDNTYKQIGTIDQYVVALFSSKQKATKKVSLLDNGTECCYVVGIFFKHTTRAFFKLIRIWTDPDLRNQGLALKLKRFLNSKWRCSFVSDRDLSPGGLGLWRKVKDNWNVFIYDVNTNEKMPWNDATEKQLFVPEDEFLMHQNDKSHPVYRKADRYYLISEQKDFAELINLAYTNGMPSGLPKITSPLGVYQIETT